MKTFSWQRVSGRLLLAAGVVLMQGCAAVSTPDPRDPWEGMNRTVMKVNHIVDEAVTKPIAKTYVFVVPQVFRTMVNNFFGNLGEIGNVANNVLQGKPKVALSDSARFIVNTVFGFGGVADVATEMGLQRSNEDFGQTLGRWGVPAGPFVVLPVLGPSTVRDSFGRVVDQKLTPLSYYQDEPKRWGLTAVNLVDLRSNLFEFDKILENSAVDPYAFVRNGYLQRRTNLIYDGEPPEELPKYEKD
jgi:phospholipid-binding lipoprotein MlaA